MIARSPDMSSTPSWALGKGQAFVARRTLGIPAWVLLTQIFIGLGWSRAAVEKIIDGSWWGGSGITTFLAEQSSLTLGWYQPVVDHIVRPNVAVFAIVVVCSQLLAAASLLSGRLVGYGLLLGMFMNVNFLAAGSVNPSAFYLLSQGALALWLAEQAEYGTLVPRVLSVIAVLGYVIGVMSLPYIGTLHPAEVMKDPGIMVALAGALTVIGCDLAHRRVTDGDGLPILTWFTRSAGAPEG
ncbi:MAG: hypothetical protein OEM39_07355 [Acidimicrobiia bacterium]|nr:hypothetical protein [Acidimicrobiia bacterium]MDH3462283.1 hypothetical protein [Acidimicrobiia bacterium]